MGRALAHARGSTPGFDDPFAIRLLPDDCRAAVERRIERRWPRSRREAGLFVVAGATEPLMGPRTVEIDDAIRPLAPGAQLVVLGAGLDARAYRMPELAGSVVFEVDHPASQAFKRRQVAGLVPSARELRHVPVDFERERSSDALARAGHDATVPTTWVFEGVISYLEPRDVEAAVDAIAERSAPGSRLILTYNEPSGVRSLFSGVTRRTGEPQRATYTREAIRELLERRAFGVRSDRDGLERAARWGRSPTPVDRVWVRFHHVVVADLVGRAR